MSPLLLVPLLFHRGLDERQLGRVADLVMAATTTGHRADHVDV